MQIKVGDTVLFNAEIFGTTYNCKGQVVADYPRYIVVVTPHGYRTTINKPITQRVLIVQA